MTERARYQFGSLTRRKRVRGGDVWQFRFNETTVENRRCRRSRLIGTLAQYPTRADILRVVERWRLRINLKHRFPMPVTLDAVVNHYVEQELPILRYGTQQSHLCTLHRWILPRWGRHLLEQVKPVDVEEWLGSLLLAPKSKANIRSLFHLIYVHARRWELTDSNPIDLVRQSAGRRQLAEPYRTMVLVAACLGLRVSEIIGLQWGDFNWDDLTLLVKRSVVQGRVGDTKTEASHLPLPVDPRLARILREHWKRSLHRQPQDWVFGNLDGGPKWQESILHRQLKPAALRAGLGKIGWHTLRHSYSTVLRSLHVDLKVQQELLRHATIQSTINFYARAIPKQKRAANRLVVGRLLRAQSRKSMSLVLPGKRDPKGTDCNWVATPQRTQTDWNDGT